MNCSDVQNPFDAKSVHIRAPNWKRVLDVTVILLMLPLVAPVAVAIGVIIALVSPGPILFRQERVGLIGRRFMCLKFRTMFVDAETGSHQGHLKQLMQSNAPMLKLDKRGDSRIIPFGYILRSSGLDELPQLINVLVGDMSLVGPRPCLPYESAQYQPWQMERFATLPGLTGLWQVSGKNNTTFNEMMELDIKYAREKTFWLDLAIILKTPAVIVGQVLETRQRKRGGTPPGTTSGPGARAPGFGVGTIGVKRENQPRELRAETQAN
ncbi:MAG TPA: sugar transferase [Verrucomicrobiae bacterium]|nr:sugar transferase [Verrucomicrobiae bacterium]